MDLVEYSSPDTNPNYFNDYEIDEFEEADATNEAEKDGTWDEDLPEFDFNIDFELDDSIIQNNHQIYPQIRIEDSTFAVNQTLRREIQLFVDHLRLPIRLMKRHADYLHLDAYL